MTSSSPVSSLGTPLPPSRWLARVAASRWAAWALGFASFGEASLLPTPTEALLVPIAAAEPSQARLWRLWLVATLASLLGGVAMYGLGAWGIGAIADTLARWGWSDDLAKFARWYGDWGLWVTLVGAFTPFVPWRLTTLAAGVADQNLALFLLVGALGRGARFALVAWAAHRYGAAALGWLERRGGWFAVLLAAACLVLVWMAWQIFGGGH